MTPSSSADFDVSTITTREDLLRLADDWSHLLERSDNVLPFMLPGWLIPWWDTYRQERRLIRDSLRTKVVRRGGEVVGILPFMLTERPPSGPLRARAMGFLGADPYITEQRAPLYDRRCAGEVARAIADDLQRDPEWDWIGWAGLDRQSEFASALEARMPLRWKSSDTANILALPSTWEAFRSGLKRNVKESLRHGYNSLKREGLEPRLGVAETVADVDEALDTFFALHTARARASHGPPHPDRFAAARARRFLAEVCRDLAEQHVTRVFTLQVDGKPVASRIGFVLPGCLYLYYSGYDPSWARYGVMTTTVVETIKYAIALGVPTLHLSMGADVSKTRWGGATPVLHDAVSVRPRWTSEVALQLYSWGRLDHPLKEAIGHLLPKHKFD